MGEEGACHGASTVEVLLGVLAVAAAGRQEVEACLLELVAREVGRCLKAEEGELRSQIGTQLRSPQVGEGEEEIRVSLVERWVVEARWRDWALVPQGVTAEAAPHEMRGPGMV